MSETKTHTSRSISPDPPKQNPMAQCQIDVLVNLYRELDERINLYQAYLLKIADMLEKLQHLQNVEIKFARKYNIGVKLELPEDKERSKNERSD